MAVGGLGRDWLGGLAPAPGTPWQATEQAMAAGTAAQAGLPAGTLPLERLQVIVPAMAATDPLRLHLEPSAVITAARCLISGMVDCLPAAPVRPGRQATGQDWRAGRTDRRRTG